MKKIRWTNQNNETRANNPDVGMRVYILKLIGMSIRNGYLKIKNSWEKESK